jgi:hypothetical protein
MKLFNILLFLFLTSANLFSQNTDSLTKEIRIKYNYTRANLSSFDTTMINIWDESTEGGIGIAFYENSELKLIKVVFFGEIGRNVTEYYFDNGKLYFSFDQQFKYNRPIYWDETKIKELSDKEVFDDKKTIIKEDRYYFNNEVLFLWLDNEKKEIDLTLGTNLIVRESIISHLYKIKSKLKKVKQR